MKLSRFIPLSVATLLLMPCLMPSGAPVRAGETTPTVTTNPTASADDLTAEQLAETADYLMSEVTSTVMSLVMTMSYAPGQWKNYPTLVPETFVTLDVKPPPAPTDFPTNGNPPDPTPSSESPEPGTLLAGLAGAGAFVYRYYRRRRAKVAVIDGAEEVGENDEVELAM